MIWQVDVVDQVNVFLQLEQERVVSRWRLEAANHHVCVATVRSETVAVDVLTSQLLASAPELSCLVEGIPSEVIDCRLEPIPRALFPKPGRIGEQLGRHSIPLVTVEIIQSADPDAEVRRHSCGSVGILFRIYG